MTSKDDHSDSPQSYSRGWNQPRSEHPETPNDSSSQNSIEHTQEIPTQSAQAGQAPHEAQSAQPGNSAQPNAQGPYGAAAANSGSGNSGFDPNAYGPNTYGHGAAAGQPGYGAQAGGTYAGGVGTAEAPGVPGGDVEGPKPSKTKRTVGLGTALAMMLVAGIGAGGVTGYVVGNSNSNGGNGTSVSEILNSQPVNNTNSTGEEAAAGTTEAVAAKVTPAVVAIQVISANAASEGSGSIISPDGYVLTNHHVVSGAENGGTMQVTMNDGTKHEAEFVASDANTDVAVIKIVDGQDLPFLEFGDSSSLQVGQEVVAVGSPLGLNATVTSGIVSAVNRPVRASQGGGESSLIDAIQTDAAVNPGNSGGPLVDMSGNLVGMNSMIASLSSGTSGEAGSIGLGFAIPSNFAQRMAQQLIDNGQVVHPMLGVQVDGRNITDGAHIVSVEPGSVAEQAGLEEGDVVTRVNDRAIEDADSLIASIRGQEFGAVITLEVTRENEDSSREVEVTLPEE